MRFHRVGIVGLAIDPVREAGSIGPNRADFGAVSIDLVAVLAAGVVGPCHFDRSARQGARAHVCRRFGDDFELPGIAIRAFTGAIACLHSP